MQNPADRFSIGKSSEYLGVSIDTLRRWEKKGVIIAYRSPGGHRYFLKQDLDKLFGQKYTRLTPVNKIKEKEDKHQTVEKTTQPPQTATQDIKPQHPTPAQPISSVLQPLPAPATIPQEKLLQPTPVSKEVIKKEKREIPWSKILIIAIALFVIADLIILAVYLTSSRPLVSPIP